MGGPNFALRLGASDGLNAPLTITPDWLQTVVLLYLAEAFQLKNTIYELRNTDMTIGFICCINEGVP
jgi:hypothetical protein